MPIQFRCTHCGQLMSISQRQAGAMVTCPACVHRIQVPQPQVDRTTAHNQIEENQLEEPVSQTAQVARTAVPGMKSADPVATDLQVWQRRPDPWRNPEEGEAEFRIASPELQEPGLDMTPMVDVTFLLLIFFMITASFTLQKSLETTPPSAEESGVSPQAMQADLEAAAVIVGIDAQNVIRVDDVPVPEIDDLVELLRGKISTENKTEMLIEVDPAAAHGTVVAVTDAGITAQMQRIRRASSGRSK